MGKRPLPHNLTVILPGPILAPGTWGGNYQTDQVLADSYQAPQVLRGRDGLAR